MVMSVSESEHLICDSRIESKRLNEVHMQIPVGDMLFHVFGVANNSKYFGWRFENDRHPHYELIYTLRGRGYYYLDGNRFECRKGDFFFTPRTAVHHGEIAEGEELWESLVIELDFSFRQDPEDYLDDLAAVPVLLPFYRHFIVQKNAGLRATPEIQPQLELVVERLCVEISHRPFNYMVVLQSQMLELLALVCRAAREEVSRSPKDWRSEAARRMLRLEKARQYIENNYKRKLQISALGEHACISPHHFMRLFKEAFGVTPFQYQNQLRITEAKRLLTHTDEHVCEIGYQLGYSSPEYFSRSFTVKVGVSPSVFAERSNKLSLAPLNYAHNQTTTDD